MLLDNGQVQILLLTVYCCTAIETIAEIASLFIEDQLIQIGEALFDSTRVILDFRNWPFADRFIGKSNTIQLPDLSANIQVQH